MNRQETINRIIEIGKKENLGIEFCGSENTIDFNYASHQSIFKFDIQINYSGIKSRRCFYLNVPALNLYQNELEEYVNDINKANDIVRDLNYLVKKLFED
jgi:hypothetical protein